MTEILPGQLRVFGTLGTLSNPGPVFMVIGTYKNVSGVTQCVILISTSGIVESLSDNFVRRFSVNLCNS